MARHPSLTTSCTETGGLNLCTGALFSVELLAERNEKACRCAILNRLTVAGFASGCRLGCKFLLLSVRNLVHLGHEIWLLLVTQEQTEIVVLLFILLCKVEFFLVAWCVVEAEVLGDGAFACTRDHGQRRAQLSIEIVFQRNDHF